MDLSVGWAYAEVIVGGELGDHVDGCASVAVLCFVKSSLR
jgi:hypothetical protein